MAEQDESTPKPSETLPSLRRLELLRAELESRRRELPDKPVEGAPGGAFLGSKGPEVELFSPEGRGGSALAGLANKAPGLGAGFYGAERGAAKAAALTEGMPGIIRTPAIVLGGAAGGAAAATGVNLSYEEAKRRLGLDLGGEPSDSFSESLAHSLGLGTDVAMSEAIGRTIPPIAGKILAPGKPDLSAEEQANMTEMQGRLRGMYEKLTGRPAGEISWNPFKRNQPIEASVDDLDAARRLRDTLGISPDEARKVVMTGGQNLAEASDNSLYGFLQKYTRSTIAGSKYLERYKGTRAKMLQMAANDIGSGFGEVVPPERLGEVISNAIDGKFGVLNAVRGQGVSAVRNMLPEGFTLNGKALKQGFSTLVEQPDSMIAHLTDSPTFTEVQHVRESLGVMAHDLNLGPNARANAAAAAAELDKRIIPQLPAGANKDYAKWTGADDAMNEGQFNTEFVRGLMGQTGAYDKYAEKLISSKNARQFAQLEAAAGPEVANNVRASIWKRVAAGATEGETLRPDRMVDQLYKDGKYGKTFLESVMGKDAIGSYERLANSMQTLNTRMQESGGGRIGLGPTVTKAGLTSSLLGAGYLHGVTATNAGLAVGLLFSPAVVGKLMTNPHAVDLAAKLAQGIANKAGPQRLSRLTGYIMDAAGLKPEEILASSGMVGTQGFAAAKQGMEEGRLPWAARKAGEAFGTDLDSQWNNTFGTKKPTTMVH